MITKSSNIFVLFLLPFFLIYFFNNQITKSYFLSIKLVASYLLVLFIVLSFQFLRIYKETGYLGYNYQSGNALLSYVYPCLSTKFGCGKKNLDSMKKGIELYDNELKISDSTEQLSIRFLWLKLNLILFNNIHDKENYDSSLTGPRSSATR